MDSEQYCEILEEGVDESFETLEMAENGCYFQQDNDLKHTSKKADQWFLLKFKNEASNQEVKQEE